MCLVLDYGEWTDKLATTWIVELVSTLVQRGRVVLLCRTKHGRDGPRELDDGMIADRSFEVIFNTSGSSLEADVGHEWRTFASGSDKSGREREREVRRMRPHKKRPCAFRAEPTHANPAQRKLEKNLKTNAQNYKFCKSLHRFLGRPSLLVVFVRNHGVHLSMRAGQRSDCIVLTFCTICCLRFRWRSHQSVDLYFAASSSSAFAFSPPKFHLGGVSRPL